MTYDKPSMNRKTISLAAAAIAIPALFLLTSGGNPDAPVVTLTRLQAATLEWDHADDGSLYTVTLNGQPQTTFTKSLFVIGLQPSNSATVTATLGGRVSPPSAALVFAPQAWFKAETSAGQLQASTDLVTWTNVSSPFYTTRPRTFFRAIY